MFTIKDTPIGVSVVWFAAQAIKGLCVRAKKVGNKYFVTVDDLVSALKERNQTVAATFWEGVKKIGYKKRFTNVLAFSV